MILKDILVHIDTTPACRVRLEAAAALAQKHGANMTGLYVYAAPRLERSDQQPDAVRKEFFAKFENSGISTKWLPVDLGYARTTVAEMIGYHACFTDLLIIGQPTGERTRAERQAELTGPERLLLGSGRPVLIIPRTGQFPRLGERIMVAWKAGPKASRAMHDAMSLLRTAKHVSLVTVGDSDVCPQETELLTGYLARHAIEARLETVPTSDLSTGDTLLNLVADEGIDLLVLGVHIVTRHGHLDMGEVARYLLSQMTVPMLLSH